MMARPTERVDDDNTIDAKVLEVCQVEHPADQRAVVLAMVLAGDEDGQLEPVRVHHALRSRKSVEDAIAAIRAAADELWPLS